jgi:hypothetical protein
MRYEYVGFPGKDPKAAIYRPYLVVRAASKEKFTDTFCLIDSGADYCMMPSSLGKLIGIDVKSGPEQEIKGIGAQPVKGYFHPVHITVPKLASFDATVAFCDELKYGVLGQEGFFQKFRVVFDRKTLQFELLA